MRRRQSVLIKIFFFFLFFMKENLFFFCPLLFVSVRLFQFLLENHFPNRTCWMNKNTQHKVQLRSFFLTRPKSFLMLIEKKNKSFSLLLHIQKKSLKNCQFVRHPVVILNLLIYTHSTRRQ